MPRPKKRPQVPAKWIRNKADETAIAQGCWFDQAAADHVCDFIETFISYTKGNLSLLPPRVKLLPWQRDFLSRLMGWKRPDNARRFRSASVWLAKKNGKTTLAAWILIYLLCADGELGAEIYSVANSRRQAGQVYREAKAVIDASDDLKEELACFPSSNRIIFAPMRSFYEVLSSLPANAEGFDASAIIFDELHRQKNDDLFNALRWAGSARSQPLFITISTSGVFDPTTISFRSYKAAKDIADGINDQTTDLLPIIYEIDADDDWTLKNPNCEEVWRKANPSLGTTIKVEDFRRDVIAIESSPSSRTAFLRYRLNLWANASTTWIPDDRWQKCSQKIELTAQQIAEADWTAGLDASSTTDLTSLVLVGRLEDKTYVVPYYWCNEEQASQRQKRDQVNYELWAEAEHIIKTPGSSIDYDRVRGDIINILKKYPIKKLAIDRWNVTQLAQQLDGAGLPVVWFGQGFKDMSPAIRELERLIYSGELVHSCPVLRWMMSNVHIETDDAGNVKASKKRSREKIDGVVAMAMAVGVAITQEKQSVYESRGIQFF